MQHPDDVLRVVAVERHPGMGGLQGRLHQLPGREVGVDHVDRHPVDHHLAHIHVGKVEDAAQHAAIAFLHQALGVMVFHRPPDLLVGG